jgi:hypothetical protein
MKLYQGIAKVWSTLGQQKKGEERGDLEEMKQNESLEKSV